MNKPQTPEAEYPQTVIRTVTIAAPAEQVWTALTDPEQIKQWMSPDSPVEITTDWVAGKPFIVRGPWYQKTFENQGIVLTFEPNYRLAYTHLSSLSRLAPLPAHFTTLDFIIKGVDAGTEVTLTLTNFPTAAIYHHFAYYWQVTLHVLKRSIEQRAPTGS